jgi:hypothetical protein
MVPSTNGKIREDHKAVLRRCKQVNTFKRARGVLGRLVDNHEHLKAIFKQEAVADEEGILRWDEDSFKKRVTADQPLSSTGTFIPTLWCVFAYFAGFPFIELIFTDFEGLTPQHQCIDEGGFVRAYSLLAVRGVELLGNAKDGFNTRGSVEKAGLRNLLASRR